MGKKLYGVIYMAKNLINGKIYIGQTVDFVKRKSGHIRSAEKNLSNMVFGKAIKKYGRDSFNWTILENAESKKELDEMEIKWIKFHKSYDRECGYNVELGGNGPGKCTEETILKNSLSHIGQPAWNKGKKLSEDHRKNLSLSHIGIKHSEESKEKRRQMYADGKHPSLGIKQSLNTRIDKSNRARKISKETNDEIIRLRKIGITYAKIAKELGVSPGHVRDLTTGRYFYTKNEV